MAKEEARLTLPLLRTLKKKVLKFTGFAAFLSLKLEDRQRKCLNLSADQKVVSSTSEQTDLTATD
jgi:hypothetical protein